MTSSVPQLLKLLATMAVSGIVATVAPTQAAAQTSTVQDASSLVTIVFCNKSAARAVASVSWVEPSDNQFWIRGWVILEPGVCRTMANTYNMNFYAYAETFEGPSFAWQGSHNLCVEWPAAFHFKVEGTTCRPGQLAKPFVALKADVPGEMIWNLAPFTSP